MARLYVTPLNVPFGHIAVSAFNPHTDKAAWSKSHFLTVELIPTRNPGELTKVVNRLVCDALRKGGVEAIVTESI